MNQYLSIIVDAIFDIVLSLHRRFFVFIMGQMLQNSDEEYHSKFKVFHRLSGENQRRLMESLDVSYCFCCRRCDGCTAIQLSLRALWHD